MSVELVREVSRENPDLLTINLGWSCFQHTSLLVNKLRARGRDAFFVCKTRGEGQYTPPGFIQRNVKGLDGQTYFCTGVSHDAIYCDGEMFDTLGSANEHDRPIFKKSTAPFWSFEPTDGPQIIASPVWNEIARTNWRSNNPPLTADVVPPTPGPSPTPPPPSTPVFPSYEALGGDSGAVKITQQLEADYKRAGRPGLDGGCGAWLRRTDYDFLVGNCKTVEESIAKHRAEWCGALGIPVS